MTRSSGRLRLIAILLVLALALPGRPPVALIGVSIQGDRSSVFYQQLQDALLQAAGTYSYRVIVQRADKDPAKQQRQIEDFIAERVDAIVVVPVDSQEIDPAILEANAASIPIFTVDIGSLPGEGRVVASITSDNRSGGFAAGNELCAATQTGTEIAILDQPGITSVDDRVNGFKNAIDTCSSSSAISGPVNIDRGRKSATDVNQTLWHASKLWDISVGSEPTSAADAMITVLNEHPRVRGVFAINDTIALGALAVILEAGQQDKDIQIVGYDDTPAARDKVKAGKILAEIAQDPGCLGSTAIRQVNRELSSRDSRVKPPITVEVPVAVDESGLIGPARTVESSDTHQGQVVYPGCDD